MPKTKFPTGPTCSYEREIKKMVSLVGKEALRLVGKELMNGDAVVFKNDVIFDGLKKMLVLLKRNKIVFFLITRKNEQQIAL